MDPVAPQPNGAEEPPATLAPDWSESTRDTEMKDEPAPPTPSNAAASAPEAPSQPQSQPHSRAHTPTRPSQTAPATAALPSTANPHGAPVRIYLNQKVTPHLLEGMKYLAVHEPEKPLKWLAEFLQKKSEEIEGS